MLDTQSIDRRLAALAAYGILDTPVEQQYEDLVRFASYALDMPIALISFVAEHRQWFKSEVGLDCRETPLGTSVCAHAIRQEDAFFEVPDLALDARFADFALVTGEPWARSYAAALLRSSDGVALGTLCVLDRKPRTLSAVQREILLGLARQIMSLLELRRALHRAAEFQHSQTQMMAIAGHDLKQPLQLISISLELALRQSTAAPVLKALTLASDAVKKLGDELDHLANTAARGLEGALPAQRGPIAIGELFASLAPAWREQAALKGLGLRIAPSSASVVSDRRLLSSIVGNLVGNAIKYTPAGRILVGCRRRREGLEICVIDTGIGIAAEDQAAIFAPFRQMNAASEGLGLGLTLVRQAAELLHYRIRLASVVGRGTAFGILIPRDTKT